jgi:hypothetical protein
MTGTFDTALGPVCWTSDDAGLELTIGSHELCCLWPEITAAGLLQGQVPAAAAGAPSQGLGESGGPPRPGRMLRLKHTTVVTYRQLVLALGSSYRDAARIPIPMEDPEAMALVAEVRSRVGARWRGQFTILDQGDDV